MMENALSKLLRRGALSAGALILLGLFLAVARGQHPVDLSALTQGATFGDAFVPPPPGRWLELLGSGSGADWMRLGLFCLVLLPVARVGFTVAIFLRDGDRRMAALAGVVFAILIGSLVLGRSL